ncbi:hypothetical protein [Sulfuricurvum sp.]|uniref:hypothetical protein n=1 Tax=Sulfuricurvum sp. TaxID=2025608 RepID=UPI003BB7D85B
MIDLFKEHRKNFQEKLIEKMAVYYYRYTRYHTNYSVVICYVAEAIDLSIIKTHIRKSDEFFKLNNHLYAFVLDSTDDAQGIKTANNILSIIQPQYFSKHLYMAVVTASNYTDTFQTIHDLFDLIEYALHHNINNSVIDSTQPVLHEG